MAPPRKGDAKKTKALTVHLTEKQMEDLKAASDERGKPMAVYVHDLVVAALWDRAQNAVEETVESSWRERMGL